MVLGVLIFLASLFADQIALGMPGSGFGMKQLTGTILGLGVIGGGIAIFRKFPSLDEEPEPETETVTVKDEEA